VAFCASVSAAAVSVREQVLHELEQTVRQGGADPETVSLALELMQMALAYGESGAGWEEYSAAIELAPARLAEAFPASPDDWRWAWYRRVLDFDPLPVCRKLSIPCLFVYGEKDEEDNLPVRESVRRLQSWIGESGRTDVLVRVFPESGHALEDPATGWIRQDFLGALSRWIVESRAVR
jgi:pimeloyl-ACP methyl ester carboxylesterase